MFRHLPSKVLFAVITFGFTAFVFMNTYEVVFNRDIAFAQSVKEVAAQQVINSAVHDFASKSQSEDAESNPALENIDRIDIPALDIQVKIEESRKINNEWYARPSIAHYVGLNKNQFGVTVDYLLYTSKSWRTIPHPDQIEKGMEVRLSYGNGARSLFTVAEKKVLPFSDSLLVSKSEGRQILLIVEDGRNNVYYGYSLVLEN